MEYEANGLRAKTKLLIKAMIIGAIILILQIPTFYITNLIEERENRQKDAITEVSSKWAGAQTITGPMLVLPYWETGDSTNRQRTKHLAYFLPDELIVNGNVTPQEKYRGIYKVILYASKMNLSGSFSEAGIEKLNILPQDVAWNEAFVQINISDIKGLNEDLKIKWNEQLLTFSTGQKQQADEDGVMIAALPINNETDLKNIHFSAEINLSGSDQLLFTPVGKSTTVNLNSSWPHPSFTGNILPQTTTVKDSGFTATWTSLALKRNFPQQWKDNGYEISSVQKSKTANAEKITVEADNATNNIANSSFGANLFIPVNGYQKTMRSVKYSFLCILLTFAAFFLIETRNKKSVHPFQYGLIGLALVLFYTLLLSISEYTGFNLSYLIASAFTIALITWFVKSLLDASKLTMLLAVILMLTYSYVFTILQLEDYSLLLGSIGLFVSLAIVMGFSKKIQW